MCNVDEARLAASLADLIAIPSINPFDDGIGTLGTGETAVANYVAERLSALGWHTEVDEYDQGRANVVARAIRDGAGDRPAIVLAGHLDTVEVKGYEQPFLAQRNGRRIAGRGACDMKAGLACYLEVAEILAARRTQLSGDLIIAGVADEEYRQQGAKVLHDLLPPAGLVVIGEPTELRICTATKGLAVYTVTVTGQATHGSVPDAGQNAILSTSRVLDAISAHGRDLGRTTHALLGPAVLNVGVIRGGTKANVVPPSCDIQLSRRLLPGESPVSARSLLEDALTRHLGQAGSWTLSQAWWTVDPYENDDQEAITSFQRTAAACGLPDTQAAGFPGSSDAPYFGPPVIVFGPGSLNQAHSLDEWVDIDQMITATSVYLRFVVDQLGTTIMNLP